MLNFASYNENYIEIHFFTLKSASLMVYLMWTELGSSSQFIC